ncbi:hypothetical protein EB796_017820 [Bugula neritina]|uniref:Uncharacterized protein n=1 Tax=Bugula neritina TaxID=10212 RepID=A0A7J7JD83_BUGNE|nr:hypothetical protein EB796_017820 [Bugula neritina]
MESVKIEDKTLGAFQMLQMPLPHIKLVKTKKFFRKVFKAEKEKIVFPINTFWITLKDLTSPHLTIVLQNLEQPVGVQLCSNRQDYFMA